MKVKSVYGYQEQIITIHQLLLETKGQMKFDCVELDTGEIGRKDYKKPLPAWLDDVLIRQMVAATGKVPEPLTSKKG